MLPAIGEYEILGELGAGAYGEVYRARHRRLDRLVALKVLWNSAEDLGRFRREMQVLARLHHPGLVKLLDADHGAGRAYIAFELIDGPNLEACIGRFAPFPWPTATAIAITVARAISYLHDQGVLHRDVKPANVLLSRSTGIKLADFGLVRWSGVDARLTRTGERLGTLIYLPPEAIDSELTTNGDLWALGCTLYQMLTGRMHLCADDFDAWSKKIICGGFPAPSDIVPSVPVELSDFVLSMLSVDPHSRPGTAAAVAQRLEGLLPAGVTVESLLAPPGLHKLLEGLEQAGAAIEEPAKTRRLEPRERSHRRTAALLAVVIGAASVLLLVCWIRSRPETPRLAQRLTPEALWQAGKEAEAVNACKEALRTDGGNAALHAQLGSYLEKLGRIPEAMDHIRSSLALSHRDDLERQFCMMLVQNRQVDEAVSRLRRQVRLHPKPEDFAALAIALEKQGHLESAERSAREAMQLAPTNAHYVGIRAAIHYSMGRYDEAIQGLRKALRQIPNEPQFRTQLGLALQKSHRLDEAITELRTAVRLSPPVSFTHYLLAVALADRGLVFEAAIHSRQAMAAAPENDMLRRHHARCLQELDEFEELEIVYQDGIRLNPRVTANYRGLCELLVQQFRLAEANGVYRKAMRAVPTEDWAGMNAQVRGHRKTITDPAAMVSLWAVELTMRRIKTGITARLFMFFRKRSLLPDLLEKLKELLKTSTGTDTTPWIHFLRGDTLRALKRPTEAEAEYRAAISIDPNVPTFHEHLVYILQEQKRPVEAAAEFRVASNLRLREKDAPLR